MGHAVCPSWHHEKIPTIIFVEVDVLLSRGEVSRKSTKVKRSRSL